MEASVDWSAFMRQLERDTLVYLLRKAPVDNEDMNKMIRIIDLFVRHGIRATEAVEIMGEMGRILQE